MYEDERKHWITTCCRNGKVEVYDSCFTGSLSPSIREMLVRLYRPFLRDDCLVVTMKPIPQQKGASDCGLFAISAAFQSAAGLRSSTLMQEKLRQHVEELFHSGEVTPFPVAANRAKNSNKTKHIVIRVYCMCKLPEEYDRHMVECEQCKTWCHYKCVGIKRKPKSFVCATCRPS